jgi:DivIVA domain-containing protein
MFWLMVVVIAAVVFATVGVAAGAGGTLATPAGDPPPLPERDGTLDAAALAEVRFPVVLRGYRMEAVDAVLDRVGAELAARDARIAELEVAFGVRPETSES